MPDEMTGVKQSLKQPQIWKLIGYEFYPTDHQGPHMKPFDESVLAEVMKKPKFYREA